MSRCFLCSQRLVGEDLGYGHSGLVVESRHILAGWWVYVQTGRVDEKVLACDFAVRENYNAKKRISSGHDMMAGRVEECGAKEWKRTADPGANLLMAILEAMLDNKDDLRSIEVYTRQKRR